MAKLLGLHPELLDRKNPTHRRYMDSRVYRHMNRKRYGTTRICFRELAYKSAIPGVKKASW